MANIFNIGTSALLSLQQSINTTGHNIANVNTDGYSRQRADFDTLPPQLSGGNYIGSGVTVDSIERIYDQFLVSEVRTRTSSHSGFDTLYQLSSRLDGMLGNDNAGLAPVLGEFFSAVQDVANNPGSLPERQVLLGQAEALADRFHYLDSNLRSLNSEVNARIEGTVGEINSLAASIASLNKQIVSATGQSGGTVPNDLLDKRDQQLSQLAKYVGVTTVTQSDGAINVMIGKGQALVVGGNAESFQTVSNPFDSTQTMIGISGAGGNVSDITRFLSGGSLGAVLDFREDVLNPAANQLGLIAVGLTSTFNEQHQLGIDLDGNPGGDFFQPLTATSTENPANTGSASVSATIADATALTGDDYNLRFDGSQWVLTNLANNSSQSGAGPFSVGGLTVSTAGTPASGDSFLIQPTRLAIGQFAVALSRPEDFAAASPLRAQQALSNQGSADITGLRVSDPSGLPLAGAVTLTFNPDALGAGVPGFDMSGIAGGPLAYNPATESAGKSFSLAGFEFSIDGVPQAGDELVIENNTSGTGDNGNALNLASLQISRELMNGSASYQEAYASTVADVAVKTSQSEKALGTEQVLLDQSVSARESVSGVNLDEEAANLIRYQQAYQAAAQIIAVADELFQTLLSSVRR